MFTTILLIVLLLIAVGCIAVGIVSKRAAVRAVKEHNDAVDAAQSQERGTYGGYSRNSVTHKQIMPFGSGDKVVGYFPAWTAVVPLALALIIAAFACTAIVDAKNEGVLLTFKKPSDRLLDSGLALKAPWQSVVEIDGTRKTDNFNDGKPNDEDDPVQDHSVVKCRLGDNGVAEVYASINWFRAEGTSNLVYAQYRAENPVEEMRENLVVPRFKDAINQTCANYRPSAAIDQLAVDFSDPEQVADALKNLDLAPDFAALSATATDNMNDLLAKNGEPLVTVENISISYLTLPTKSQAKIDLFLDEANKTRIALQSQATNAATAKANEILSESISNDPNVLVARCYDLIADGLLTLPAGGSCWPGGGGSVVIPSAK